MLLALFVFRAFASSVDSFEDNDLPNFLIIGAQKSGTTIFSKILRQNPLIFCAKKELHFFDAYFNNGADWYKSQFQTDKDAQIKKGEKTPYYLFHPFVAERVHSLIPDVKLIVLLRNPIDRAYSQFWMNLRQNVEDLSFTDAIKMEPLRLAKAKEEMISRGASSDYQLFSYLSRGHYAEQLRNWFKYFSCEQILIISFDEFLQNPDKIMAEVLLFLGLPEYKFIFQKGSKLNFDADHKHRYPPMSPMMRKRLSDYFRPYNEELEILLDRKFGWD